MAMATGRRGGCLGKPLPTVLPGGPIKTLALHRKILRERGPRDRSRGRLGASDAQTLRER